MARLVVNPGMPNQWEIQLKPGTNTLGRSFNNDFKIDDPSVSGRHCEVVVTGMSALIRDLGSTNGTTLDGSSVGEAGLKPGAVIRLGVVEVRYFDEGAPTGGAVPPLTALEPRVAPSVTTRAIQVRPVTKAPELMAPAPAAPPPIPALPPRIGSGGADAGASGRHDCRFHPKTAARFFCRQCQQYVCDLCVNTRQVGGVPRKFCRACGAECESLRVERPGPVTARRDNFFRLALAAFGYPLRGDGVVLLVAGTIFFTLLNAARFFAAFAGLFGLVAILILTVIGTGYLVCYLRRIVTSSAMGEVKMPDWPDISDLGSDILAPFFQFLGTLLACFAPAILSALVLGNNGLWVTIAAVVFGCLYLPMAFLAVAMLDTVAAVNPLVILPTIFRMPLAYSLTLVGFGILLVARWGGDVALSQVLPGMLGSIAASVISSLVGLYLLTVTMRILGLLYLTHKQRFGWLRH